MTLKTIKKKSEEQSKALNAWHTAGYRGSIIAGTGFGKSRCGVLAVAHSIKDGGKGLVLVPTNQLQDQFAEEFKKWGHESLLDRVDILCYQSAHKLEGERYDIVVCDEVHLGLSPVYRQFFYNNHYDRVLAMTATLPEDDEYRDLLSRMAPTVYHISLDECVDKGLVAPYDIYCIPVDMTEDERVAYRRANQSFVHNKYLLGGYDAFNEANRILKGAPGDKKAAVQFFNAIRRRKSIVQHAVNKIELTKDLVGEHSSQKILCFAGTIEFTNTIAAAVDGDTYHSKMPKKKRQEALDRFAETDDAILCTVKALNQGFDAPDVEIGIIAGLESKALPMIQRLGRLIRYKRGKRGRVYILYVKDSQEQKWMEQATKSLTNVKRVETLTNFF
tara:strand:- start:5338 stop:6501 length:1164 start_codon:yes stop_codon:yes gene_type:complete